MTRREVLEHWGLYRGDHVQGRTRYDADKGPMNPVTFWATDEWLDVEVELVETAGDT